MPEFFTELAEKLLFQRASRSEIRVPALGFVFLTTCPVPSQKGLSQACARGDHGDDTIGRRLAGIKCMELLRFQERHGTGGGGKIVQQPDGSNAALILNRFGIRDPRKVGDLRPAPDDRPGDGEAGPVRRQVLSFKKGLDQGLDPGIAIAGKNLLRQRLSRIGAVRKNGQAALRAADISHQKHLHSSQVADSSSRSQPR